MKCNIIQDNNIEYFVSKLRERNQTAHHEALHYLQYVFNHYKTEIKPVIELARTVKDNIETISPLIQSYTELICPSCKENCCINKHGFYNFEDLVYLHALGIKVYKFNFSGQDSDPCQFLSSNGCILERQYRPSGCNWYFCNSLLQEMEKSTNYDKFEDSMTRLAKLWMDLTEQFNNVILKITPLNKIG